MATEQNYNVLGICGSLREKSYNMMALKIAGGLMPAGMRLPATFSAIRLYDLALRLPHTPRIL